MSFTTNVSDLCYSNITQAFLALSAYVTILITLMFSAHSPTSKRTSKRKTRGKLPRAACPSFPDAPPTIPSVYRETSVRPPLRPKRPKATRALVSHSVPVKRQCRTCSQGRSGRGRTAPIAPVRAPTVSIPPMWAMLLQVTHFCSFTRQAVPTPHPPIFLSPHRRQGRVVAEPRMTSLKRPWYKICRRRGTIISCRPFRVWPLLDHRL